MYRFVYTESGKLIDTSKCLSATVNEFTICYRKNKFTPSVQEKILHHAETIPEVAWLVVQKMIPGTIFTKVGRVARGAYPPTLVNKIGYNQVITSIWINTNEDTMVRWWDKARGILK